MISQATTGLFKAKSDVFPLLIIFMENEKDAVITKRGRLGKMRMKEQG